MPSRSDQPPGLNRPLSEVKAELYKALGHPARVRALEVLAEGERTVGELQPLVGIESSHLSQQLGVRRRAGLVTTRKEGASVVYALKDPPVAELPWRSQTAVDGGAGRDTRPARRADRTSPHPMTDRSQRGAPAVARAPWFRTAVWAGVAGLTPRRADYAGLARSWRRDLVAGLTVAVVALPLALAVGITTGWAPPPG